MKKTRIGILMILALFLLMENSAGARSFTVVDTGQERCYDNFGPIPCPARGDHFYGQDAQYDGNLPAYRDDGNGTVQDLNTGLVWQKSPDLEKGRSRYEAGDYCEELDLAGKTDWRLPTIKELYSLIDFSGSIQWRRPYIDTRVFDFQYPDTGKARIIDAQYWSSNDYIGTNTGPMGPLTFGVNFADGRIKGYPQHAAKWVRCVRGKDYGINDFKDNKNGTVTDRATGLTWAGSDSKKTLNWSQSLNYCENLTLAGKSDWRLPNAKELQSIVDYNRAPDAADLSRRSAAIDPIFEITEDESWFWTSTTHGDNIRAAVYIAFGQALSEWKLRNGKNMNVHGAGAQRSDPKTGNPIYWSAGLGPQKDQIRIYNYARCVRND